VDWLIGTQKHLQAVTLITVRHFTWLLAIIPPLLNVINGLAKCIVAVSSLEVVLLPNLGILSVPLRPGDEFLLHAFRVGQDSRGSRLAFEVSDQLTPVRVVSICWLGFVQAVFLSDFGVHELFLKFGHLTFGP